MKHLPLQSHHRSIGAQWKVVEDWEISEHYGDPIQEHLAVRKGVGIADLSSRGKILITGEDRVSWLHSIISNDILSLKPGQGVYSTLMNHKGKILAYFRVLVLEGSVLVEDVGEVDEATYRHFRKFLLFGTKAKIENMLEQWGILLISGPQAGQLIKDTLGVDIRQMKSLESQMVNVQGHQVLMATTEETGEFDVELYIPAPSLSVIWDKLWAVGKSLDLHPVGRLALDSLRIEAGIPHIGPDLNEDIVPPEANLQEKAFSLSKGCYPGQEVVARMDTYGAVKRRLVGLMFEKDSKCIPERGAKIFHGDREVGWVSSASYSPTLNRSLAFGFPLRDFSKPDTKLSVDIQGQRLAATVHSLPFYPRSEKISSPSSESSIHS